MSAEEKLGECTHTGQSFELSEFRCRRYRNKREKKSMEGDSLSGNGNGTLVDNKILQHFNRSFGQVQSILDQNRLLINEINQNQESKIPDNLCRNVGLIRRAQQQHPASRRPLRRSLHHICEGHGGLQRRVDWNSEIRWKGRP
ncbi:hypothetical protein HPP92_023460 [Vanilla planifolia]|uniref:Protein EARLY FLOWERING 4 domain-containing protein n=1 Tax=Vanilla planifolia TaxID=51239 RepID=A0A835UEH3_VANPL|nr:hypothetical protein HPP92_023460 [Vanilla planifolia]